MLEWNSRHGPRTILQPSARAIQDGENYGG